MNFVHRILMNRSSLLAVSAFLASTVACAGAVTGLSGGSSFPAFNGTNQTIGWSFTVASPNDLTVTSLGFWDATPGTSLAQSHQVGIWTGDGSTLLGSITVQIDSLLSDSFRYEDVTPFVLTSGMSYLIGAAITSPFSDVYTVPASITTDAAITLTGSARNGSSEGFSAPTIVTAGNGRIGPNFEFTLNQVPEPSALLLTFTGLGLLAASRRTKSTTAS